MASLVLEGVSKSYADGQFAVHNFDLTIADQELVVLVGPSGCGKSTTLRMIAGLEQASAGSIRIGDRVVNDVPPRDRDIAMVFQNYALYPHMTVFRNMAFGLELRYGGSWPGRLVRRLLWPAEERRRAERRSRIRDQVTAAARLLGIESLLGRMPRQLSGGERQRVALGRAIVREPAAFLFDEPLSNLDAKLRSQMRRELKQLHQQLNATIVYVTHDQVEAMTLGQRVVVMNEGEIRQIGTPLEVYDHPADVFVAGFLGSPPMNLIAGELQDSPSGWEFVGGGLRIQCPDLAFANSNEGKTQAKRSRQITLGVRPEDVLLGESPPPGDGTTNDNPAGNNWYAGLAEAAPGESLGDAEIVQLQFDAKPESKAATDEQQTTPNSQTSRLAVARRGVNQAEPLLCKTSARAHAAQTARWHVYFRAGRVHLFDSASGRNLHAGQPTAERH